MEESNNITSKNIVYCAQSLDGYIAGPNGEIDWLDTIPNPEGQDMGYTALMNEVDAIVMGRNTFDLVKSFDIEWPYAKPVVVLSHSMETAPTDFKDKILLEKGGVQEVLSRLHDVGYHKLYIDGGLTIQQFLSADAIDELRITTLPVLLGKGIKLFAELDKRLWFDHVKTDVFLGQLVQSWYIRKRG